MANHHLQHRVTKTQKIAMFGLIREKINCKKIRKMAGDLKALIVERTTLVKKYGTWKIGL